MLRSGARGSETAGFQERKTQKKAGKSLKGPSLYEAGAKGSGHIPRLENQVVTSL
jgi:hypothetical protein